MKPPLHVAVKLGLAPQEGGGSGDEEPDDGGELGDDEAKQAKADAGDALIEAVHAKDGERVVSAIETLVSLCKGGDDEEPDGE